MRLALILLTLSPLFGQTANGTRQASPDVPAKPDRVISITAERFAYTPSRIKLKQGETVEFVVTSDDTDHGFRIPAAGIDAAIPQAGKGELRIRFVARERGEYVFDCSRPCGAGHNIMRGVISVR